MSCTWPMTWCWMSIDRGGHLSCHSLISKRYFTSTFSKIEKTWIFKILQTMSVLWVAGVTMMISLPLVVLLEIPLLNLEKLVFAKILRRKWMMILLRHSWVTIAVQIFNSTFCTEDVSHNRFDPTRNSNYIQTINRWMNCHKTSKKCAPVIYNRGFMLVMTHD